MELRMKENLEINFSKLLSQMGNVEAETHSAIFPDFARPVPGRGVLAPEG